MILRNGITGFSSDTFVKINGVKKLLDKIKYPYIYFDVLEPDVNNNYFTITVENKINGNKFKLLVNDTYYYITGATIESIWMELEFINLPEDLIDQIKDVGITILDKEILEKEVPKDEIKILNENEIKQIKYWGSKTYGEIIFNGYD
jgi:hypothetical protein